MSATIHEQRSEELLTIALYTGISTGNSRKMIAAKLAEWQTADLLDAAEIAAPIKGHSPVATIRALIWENREGANHGPGRTWKEYSEVLRQDLDALDALEARIPAARLGEQLLDRAKDSCTHEGIDEWAQETLELAEKLGVGGVRQEIYDPEKHGAGIDAEPGEDLIWTWDIQPRVDSPAPPVEPSPSLQ